MSYSEALELQLALRRKWVSELVMPADPQARVRTPEQIMEIQSRALDAAETYYWTPEMVDLVEAAAAVLPTCTLVPELLPSGAGFWLLARPLEAASSTILEPARLTGLLWMRSEEQGTGAPSMFLSPLLQRVETGQRVLGPLLAWPFGQSAEEICAGENGIYTRLDEQASPQQLEVRDGFLQLTKLFLAGLLFLQQRIARATPTPAERHTRRRLGTSDREREPLIRIVELRRRQYEPGPSTSSGTRVDWTHRWFVTPHWRQQACGPKRSQRRPVFVGAYVKGPEDRPLKAPRTTVFAVIR